MYLETYWRQCHFGKLARVPGCENQPTTFGIYLDLLNESSKLVYALPSVILVFRCVLSIPMSPLESIYRT